MLIGLLSPATVERLQVDADRLGVSVEVYFALLIDHFITRIKPHQGRYA